MKKILFYLLSITLIISCSKDDEKGYNCNGGLCSAVFESPQFLTLSDCQSACNSTANSTAGYNCDNGICSGVNSNAQYSTLADCESNCSSNASYGYNCVSGVCETANIAISQYSSLSLCQNSCANNTPGTLEISATWTSQYVSCNPAYTVTVGLGYTSNDIANDAFFAQSSDYQYDQLMPYVQNNLTPNIYYYKVKKTYKMSCGTGQGIPPDVIRNGSFTITAGQTTTVNVGSLN